MNEINNFKKCSKCNVEYDQSLGSWYSIEVEKQRRIFTKNGKDFCFNCLASEYNVNCRLCHKRINSKDEAAYWNGVISVNGSYERDPSPDFFDFRCLDCGNKRFDTNRPIEDQINPKKCRITGCSNDVFYPCSTQNFCKYHSKSCQGTYIGRKCNMALGSDEGDFCQGCKNQTETYQQQKDRLENESNRIYENYKRAIEQAQSWWDSLSSEEKQREISSLESRLPASIEKFWNSHGYKTDGNQIQFNAQYTHSDTFENGKLYQSDPTRVPWEIVNEFFEQKRVENSSSQVKRDNNSDKDNLLPPNSATPQPITNSNSKSDNSANPSNSPQPDSEPDKSPESKIKTIKFENKENDSKNSPNQTDNENLVINLKNVKKITLTAGGNLVIELNNQKEGNYSISQTITPDQINTSRELQKVKNYLEKNNQSSLNQQELNRILNKNNTSAPQSEKPKENNNNILLIGGLMVGVLIVGIMVGLLIKRDKNKKIKIR